MTTSRWAVEFENHAFRASWNALKARLESVEVDDQTVATSVMELARLKRVVSFIDEVINSIDPEITPKSVWANFQPQADACAQQVANFQSNKNIAHIAQANEHVDNLLTYVRPYMVLPQEALDSLKNSAKAYIGEVAAYVKSVETASRDAVLQAKADRAKTGDALTAAKEKLNRIDEYARRLLDGDEGSESIKAQISEAHEEVKAKALQIDELHTNLITGGPKSDSIQKQMAVAAAAVTAAKDAIEEQIDDVKDTVNDLDGFHEKIFGKFDPEHGERAGGLAAELQLRTAALEDLENKQKLKHAALFKQIEELLPGAHNAGLAKAYMRMKASFDRPILMYTVLFYGLLGLLVIASLILVIDELTVHPVFAIKFTQVPGWTEIFKHLAYKVPFVAAIVWLAIFSSTRRSQYERLQQEYAHKEALARSYQSYKKQIADLGGDVDALQQALIEKAIDAISFNASSTLDKAHAEKTPIQQLFDKLSIEEASKIIESLKSGATR